MNSGKRNFKKYKYVVKGGRYDEITVVFDDDTNITLSVIDFRKMVESSKSYISQ